LEASYSQSLFAKPRSEMGELWMSLH
jgi:hypothetical protein